jgi:hypothetical protein
VTTNAATTVEDGQSGSANALVPTECREQNTKLYLIKQALITIHASLIQSHPTTSFIFILAARKNAPTVLKSKVTPPLDGGTVDAIITQLERCGPTSHVTSTKPSTVALERRDVCR